jgi:amidase
MWGRFHPRTVKVGEAPHKGRDDAMHELCMKSAEELADLIRSGQVPAVDVVDAHLERIAALNPVLNAVTVTLTNSARTAAANVDAAIAAGEPVGPLAGVPVTVKENIDVAGSATTWGSNAFADQLAAIDAPVVARLREAGAIPIARTNMPDFAFRWHTESSISGHTVNPWDATRTPGGSSGGEAVALATGMTPLGLGNDLGGSLRIPSQMCGTAALRPTMGRIADAAVTEPSIPPLSMQAMNCQGPMARRVSDLRRAFALLTAPDARDPRWVPAPLLGPLSDAPLRVALVRAPLGDAVDPHVLAGIDRAAASLADAGYEIDEAEPPELGEAMKLWFDLMWADFPGIWTLIEAISGDGLRDFVDAIRAGGGYYDVDQAAAAATWAARHRIGAAWSRFAATYPIVLAPVCCERPWLVGDDIARVGDIANAMRMVLPVNALGLPSCAVPVGIDDGLPQGVQLIGARFREDLLLDAAQAIEDRSPAATPIEPKVALPA